MIVSASIQKLYWHRAIAPSIHPSATMAVILCAATSLRLSRRAYRTVLWSLGLWVYPCKAVFHLCGSHCKCRYPELSATVAAKNNGTPGPALLSRFLCPIPLPIQLREDIDTYVTTYRTCLQECRWRALGAREREGAATVRRHWRPMSTQCHPRDSFLDIATRRS